MGRPKIQNFLAVASPNREISRDHLEDLRSKGLLVIKNRAYTHFYTFEGIPPGKPGEVGLSLVFGVKRNKITWRLWAPLGLDYFGFMFAWGQVQCILSRMGYPVSMDGFKIRNVEFLHDNFNMKMEGLKALTLSDFRGNLEKIYNKDHATRREIRVSQEDRPVSEIMAFYQGGLPNFMIAQASYDVARRVEANTEAIKRSNRSMQKIADNHNMILNAIWELLDQAKGRERDK